MNYEIYSYRATYGGLQNGYDIGYFWQHCFFLSYVTLSLLQCFVYHYKYIEVGVGTRTHSSHGGSRIAKIRHYRSFVLPLALRSTSVVFACLLVLLPCLVYYLRFRLFDPLIVSALLSSYFLVVMK